MAASEIQSEAGSTLGAGISPLNGSNMFEMLLGLIVVVALIFVCAWLYKRVGGIQGSVGGTIKVVAGLSLGSRDRVALIEVGQQKILLGISPGRINTLHVFQEDPMLVSETDAASLDVSVNQASTQNRPDQNFAGKLQALLNKNGGVNE